MSSFNSCKLHELYNHHFQHIIHCVCISILGGSVSVVVDRAALSDVARTNPELQTVDVFAFRMTEDEVFEGIEEKCTIEATPTDTNDLQLALPATDKRHSSFCLRKSKVRETDK